jgi:hypothetical protein
VRGEGHHRVSVSLKKPERAVEGELGCWRRVVGNEKLHEVHLVVLLLVLLLSSGATVTRPVDAAYTTHASLPYPSSTTGMTYRTKRELSVRTDQDLGETTFSFCRLGAILIGQIVKARMCR